MSSVVLLKAVKEKLGTLGIDAFIIGSGDAHQSEYVHESDMRRAFVSKFDGSSGTALILKNKNEAYLWTDGRYFLQASKQLSSYWTLMRSGEPNVLEINDWILTNCPKGTVIGIDPYLVSASQALAMEKLFSSRGMSLKPVERNPIDEVWGDDKPTPPNSPIIVHPLDHAGVPYTEKISLLQKELEKQKCVAFVVTMLDEVMWLFNIRGSDVSYNPVIVSYAVITASDAHLFVAQSKISSAVATHLQGVIIHPYDSIEAFLKNLASSGTVLVDPSQINWRLYQVLGDSVKSGVSPITMLKAVKNIQEINGIRDCHIRDGVALTAFLHYLEKTITSNPYGNFTEYDVAEKIEEFRAKISGHVSPSFSTIAGYGPNGAIIHYKPEKTTAAKLSTDSMFLLDSGAQYADGTTDVTRTVHFGTPSDHMKYCYTLVLKGHIALGRAVFPEGTLGSRLDCIARIPLWTAGLDYNHGTGHGVGAYLNVHEGPQGIGFRRRDNEAGFTPGMTISNEPGYYEEGAFGIRIENVCVTLEASTQYHFGGRRYCKFETVTMTPIKKNLIDVNMLDNTELEWLNTYHRQVRENLLR